ncbi:uncharacterized protein LOC134831323 [Culicoides brevitarsis]|uniref:uncharacterized protein LOC134831323 n=1 Tax=Culicoides brevitarsis TaxID=469753 RepID=UPI00307C209B
MYSNEDASDNNGHSMYSNLPLLFAGGYPTSLDRISESQLEKFIPFMVQCSLGYTQMNPKFECAEPEWWPEDVEFLTPFRKPDSFSGDWQAKMKEIVVICYSFHKSIFLLRFCKQLSEYEHATLRFITNMNHTTSLYERTTNKMLVTFRNENMLYDQQQQHQTPKKTLLPKSPSSNQLDTQAQQHMVEPALFDIYLCDNCDAELYSLDACMEHEKICAANMAAQNDDDDDDDVIFIEDDELQVVPGKGKQPEFLSNFGLCSTSAPVNASQASQGRRSYGHISGDYFGSPDKLRRLPNRSRGVIALSKCATIPLSSPCGQLLLNQSKTMMSEDYQLERIDRFERFCQAPVLFNAADRPRFMTAVPNQLTAKQSRNGNSTNVTYRKPLDQEETHYHQYKFPRRQLSTKQRSENFDFLNSLLIKACKPVSVKVKRLSDTDIEICKAKLRQAAQKLSFAVPKDNHNVVEYIDLCSSDEEGGEENEQMDTSGSGGIEVDENLSNVQQKVDGIVMSMPINANCSSLLVQQIPEPPKVLPLRPSIFLFSNYQQYSSNSQFVPAPQAASIQTQRTITTATTGFPQSPRNQSHEELLAAKTNSINEWLNSTQNSMQIDHLSTNNTSASSLRQIPGLVNIQQYTTTAIHQTITTANIAT